MKYTKDVIENVSVFNIDENYKLHKIEGAEVAIRYCGGRFAGVYATYIVRKANGKNVAINVDVSSIPMCVRSTKNHNIFWLGNTETVDEDANVVYQLYLEQKLRALDKEKCIIYSMYAKTV